MREFGAILDIHEFVQLFVRKRADGGWARLPKGMRDAFRRPQGEAGFELAKLVAEGDRELEAALEAELAAQEQRHAKAESVLASPKPTKKAVEDKRIASNKIKAARRNLDDLRRQSPDPKDSRIYPGSFAPVMIRDPKALARTVVPMRYQCRLPGWTEAIERKYPGTYNARRDKLEETWFQLFGHQHGIMIVSKFYENVDRGGENVVLEFTPDPPQDMLIACLWSKTRNKDGADLWSFAAITDEPPAEVIAAGHDRCIIPIKPENLDAWLNPNPGDLAACYAILDDRPRPYYAHRVDKAA
ncbi:SOS response-associated peptidase family protein [Dyella choica]|uniref:SOS response-associated peptidase family protein n=1 Tax=Dyella choica TaxID=1927959 RepID=UPI002E793F57|nr:SOS response-associated peptidase family protein [Dyella choica]